MAAPRRLVVDANVVIAAFLRDSTVRRLLTLSFLELMAPEFLHEEVEKHLPTLAGRARLGHASAKEILTQVEEFVVGIPQDSILTEWHRASRAMAGIDPDDVPYIAAALATPCDGIWSDDPDMKKQALVPCWTTKELILALNEEGFDI